MEILSHSEADLTMSLSNLHLNAQTKYLFLGSLCGNLTRSKATKNTFISRRKCPEFTKHDGFYTSPHHCRLCKTRRQALPSGGGRR